MVLAFTSLTCLVPLLLAEVPVQTFWLCFTLLYELVVDLLARRVSSFVTGCERVNSSDISCEKTILSGLFILMYFWPAHPPFPLRVRNQGKLQMHFFLSFPRLFYDFHSWVPQSVWYKLFSPL